MQVEKNKLLVVEKIADKYMNEKNGKVAYLFARNKTIVSGPLEDMRKLTKATPAMEEFNKARGELAKEFADRDDDGAPKQEMDPRTGQIRYAISRLGALSQAVEQMLVEKYPQAKADQEEVERKTQDMLEGEIDIDFYCLELSKLPGFRDENDEDNGIIASGDLALLLELGIVYEKEDNVVELADASKEQADASKEQADNKTAEA